ncbi:MAG: flagellar M-ring protein FliF C-terminal domain-containing protein [Planctomycetota bacterium]|jgi:flagellar M-ring protein FliF
MPVFLSEVLGQMKAIWARLDGGQRMTIVAVVFAALVGMGGIVWYAGQPDYIHGITIEDPSERVRAQASLEKSGVLFKVSGDEIQVERGDYSRAWGALAAEGITGQVDPERSDNISSVTLDSATRRDLLIAKKRDRAVHAVKKLRGVVDAYVTSDKPKRMPFKELDEETNPSSTVTLNLAPGASFQSVARAAIASVSGALGIQEKYIKAVDARTNAIYRLDDVAGNGYSSSDFLTQQKARSRDMTFLAQQVLDRAYPGKAMVTVSVELDPNWERVSEKIQPATPAIIREEVTKNTSSDGKVGSGGDPSVAAPPTSGGLSSGSGGGPKNTTKSDTKNRTMEPWSGTRETGKLAPDIRSLNIALVLDETIPDVANRLTEIEGLVKAAVGYSEQRVGGGIDQIKTQVVPEFIVPPPPVAPGVDFMEIAKDYAPLFGQIVAVLIVVMFLRSLLKKGSTPLAPQLAGASSSPRGSSIDEPDEEEVELSTDEQARRMRREIEKSINEDPGSISRLLEGWLAEVQS